MPNRIIKESIHTSDKVNAMSDFQFRLWVNLITYVDDYGRGDARIPIIKGQCFPLRERITNREIETALNKLADIGCICFYVVDGRPYLYFPNWESHQTVRNHKSKYPEPPVQQLNSIESNCNQLNANVSVIQSNPIQSESESEYESNTRKAQKHKYGQYKNVLLTDDDMEKLKAEFPDYDRKIENLSEYIAKKGDKYKNHLAVIRSWARKDEPVKETKPAAVTGTAEIRRLLEAM